MDPDRAHAFAGIAMWGFLALAAACVFFLIPVNPAWGAGTAGLCFVGAATGAYYKKRFCPRCRGKRCTLPRSDTGSC
ncbi:MAG: hypothetical protein N2111_06920 [Candidatus Sumerlaeaceae bacterium]|nr:hypothetical protein [Candidatus Sumerlaeaceae bacterium]